MEVKVWEPRWLKTRVSDSSRQVGQMSGMGLVSWPGWTHTLALHSNSCPGVVRMSAMCGPVLLWLFHGFTAWPQSCCHHCQLHCTASGTGLHWTMPDPLPHAAWPQSGMHRAAHNGCILLLRDVPWSRHCVWLTEPSGVPCMLPVGCWDPWAAPREGWYGSAGCIFDTPS